VASAQLDRQFVFTPYVGVYAPAEKIATNGTTAAGTPFTAFFKQQNSAALGATASYWFNRRTGVELGGAYALSDTKGSLGSGDVGFPTKRAHVVFGAAKFMVGLLPTSGDAQLRFGFGPALISRGGEAYQSTLMGKPKGLTDFGAAASLCTRIPLGNLLAIRVRAEDYMYQARLRWQAATAPTGNLDFAKRFQHDLVFSAGLQIGFRR